MIPQRNLLLTYVTRRPINTETRRVMAKRRQCFRRAEPRKEPGDDAFTHPAAYAARLAYLFFRSLALNVEVEMAKRDYEFSLILSGVPELTRDVLDAFFEAGCDDALIGIRDGIAFADFCREADSCQEALLSAIRDVEAAGARVEHVEPDELVTMSEIARRLDITREGVRKRVAGMRGPGNFPPPIGNLTQRSPLWRWSDVVLWHQTHQRQGHAETPEGVPLTDRSGPHIAAINAALDLLRRVPLEEARQLLDRLRLARIQVRHPAKPQSAEISCRNDVLEA